MFHKIIYGAFLIQFKFIVTGLFLRILHESGEVGVGDERNAEKFTQLEGILDKLELNKEVRDPTTNSILYSRHKIAIAF